MTSVDEYAGLAATHLSGTADETLTQSWLSQQFAAAGLQTGSDAYSFLGFQPQTVSLRVVGISASSLNDLAAYFYSGVTGPGGVNAPLVFAGLAGATIADSATLAHKIAVVEVPAAEDDLGMGISSTFDALERAGAAALVLVTEGPGNYPVNQDVDSRLGVQHLPTIIVGSQSGQQVIARAIAGSSATLTLTAHVGPACDTDQWGVLPGQDTDRYVIIGTPTSAFDPAASERGAGVAIEIGLAHYYASLPMADRPVNLIFAGLSGHEVGYLGLQVLLEEHPDWFSMADAYVHLGASLAAAEGTQTTGGTAKQLGGTTPTLYVSENPVLEAGVVRSFPRTESLDQVPPSVEDPGEQAEAYTAGVPIVAESGTSQYFHTAGDEPSGVSPNLLVAQAQSFANMVTYIGAQSKGKIGSANQVALGLAQVVAPATSNSLLDAGPDEPDPVASCSEPFPTQPAPSVSTSLNLTDPSLALGLVPTYDAEQPGFAWEGNWQERAVTFTSAASGAQLSGTIFAPNPPPPKPVPGVVIVPGSGPGVQTQYQWAARELAGHGYVTLAVDPQGVGSSATFGKPVCSLGPSPPIQATPCPGVPFQQNANYVDAAESGIDFLVSATDPYRVALNPSEIGLAGHSLGARAVSYVQSIDPRVKAVVAWDNLASNLEGDAGSASGGGALGEVIGGGVPGASVPITPRVPALGEASDSAGLSDPSDTSPEIKKTAYDVWVQNGIPAMEVVFSGANHLDWAQDRTNAFSDETSLFRFEYYTRAWFDLFLRHDASALARLTATSIGGTPRTDVMSSKFYSALFLPAQGINCPVLTKPGCP
jgi:dienelactone hydrolase